MLGRVSIVVDAAMANFESDMGRASRVAEKNFKKMERDAEEMHKKMVQVGKMVGAAIATGLTTAVVAIKSVINGMDDISKAAQRANMGTAQFSELTYAAGLADVSVQDLTGTMGKLAKAQGDAEKVGSTQARLFKALGIETKNLDGSMRPTNQLLMDFADRFQQLKGSPEIMAAGMNIFGRSFQNIIPLIKDGSEGLRNAGDEARRLGLVLSDEAGSQAEAFNDNLTRLKSVVQGFIQQVAVNLLPDLLTLSERFFKVASSADTVKIAADGAREAIKGIGEAADFGSGLLRFLERVRLALVGLERQAVAFGRLMTGISLVTGTGARDEAMYAEGTAMLNAARSGTGYNKSLGRDFQGVTSYTGALPIDTSGRPEASMAPDAWRKEVSVEREAQRRKLAAEQEKAIRAAMGDTEKANNRVTRSIRERASATKEVMTLEEEWQVIQDVWDQATIDRSNREADAWARQTEVVEESTNMMSVYAEQAARNMQDAFADFLIDPLKNGFKGLLGSFADMLKKMAAQAAASKIFEAFGNWASDYSGGGAGWVNAIGAAIKGGRAIGGKVAAGSMYEVTEGGASELLRDGQGRTYLIPGSDGTVIPASDMRGGQAMGGASVTVNIHNAPGGADVQSKRNGSGGFDIDVILKQIEGGIASNVAAGASPINASLQGRYGLRTAV